MQSLDKTRNESNAKDSYLVAVKLLLRDGDKLLITHDIFGHWDIPGGRIRTDQFETPMEDILEGKLREELGKDVKYELGSIVETLRIEREEIGRDGERVRIFAVCYEATYLSGQIDLGDVHDTYEWVDLSTTDLKDYESDAGWVHKLTEYQQHTFEK